MNTLFQNILENVDSGPPLTYNNGLAIKPTIKPRHFYSEDETTKEKVIVIILKEKDLEKFARLDVKKYHLIHKAQELWLEVANLYFVLPDVPNDLIAEFREKNIILYFQKEDSTFINAFKISFQ
jgi:hypothetical protein